MNRRLLIYLAIGLMVGLYLWDRDNSTITTLPATVLSIEDRDDAAGPDTWHITADVGGETLELSPLQARPDLAPGDALCVTRIARDGRPHEYRRAGASASC